MYSPPSAGMRKEKEAALIQSVQISRPDRKVCCCNAISLSVYTYEHFCSFRQIIQLSHSWYAFCFCLVFHPSFPLMLFTQSSLRRPWACTLAKGYRLAEMVT